MTKTSKKPILRLKNVSKVFAGYQALNDVSLEVYPGQVLCLLGDNGAGSQLLSRFSRVFTNLLLELLSGTVLKQSSSLQRTQTNVALLQFTSSEELFH